MCLLGLLYVGLHRGVIGVALAAGILGAAVYSFSPNLCCFSSMTLLLLAVSGVPKSRLSCPDNKYSVSCSFWREVVIGRNLKLFVQVFQRILFSAKPFIAALTIPTISNFELFWGCYTAYFCRHLSFSFLSCARSVTISPLSGFQNFIAVFCPLSSHFPSLSLRSRTHCPSFTVTLVDFWVMCNQKSYVMFS